MATSDLLAESQRGLSPARQVGGRVAALEQRANAVDQRLVAMDEALDALGTMVGILYDVVQNLTKDPHNPISAAREARTRLEEAELGPNAPGDGVVSGPPGDSS